MKKILAILLSTSIILTACGKEKIQNRYEETTTFPKGDKCEFLIDADWECNDAQCVNVIRFNKDKSFSNWCYCGSPVGDSDIIIGYSYNEAEKSVTLYDDEGEEYEKGKILFCDKQYLIIDIWNDTFIYENLKAKRPEVLSSVYEDVFGVEGEDETKAFVTILTYENDKMVVTDYNYDGDTDDLFEKWELPVSDDVTFKSVTVTITNGIEDVKIEILTKDDIKDEDNSGFSGYITVNPEGEIDSVVFYGSTEIWE